MPTDRPSFIYDAPQGNVAQARGGVVGRKTGGRWSELPISDEELVRRYQAGAGVKALAKQLGTNHVKILRRIRATCGVIKGRLIRNKNAVKEKIAGKTVDAWMKDAWDREWKSRSGYDEQNHWSTLCPRQKRQRVARVERFCGKTLKWWERWAWDREWIGLYKYDEQKHWGCLFGETEWERKRGRHARATKNNQHIASVLRHRVRDVLRGKAKSKPTVTMLGCTLEQFRQHLQNQFKRGMAWNNMGSHWHIDHIIPCAAFDLSKPEQQAVCFHYTNMQPLEARRNMRKSDKITDAQYKLRI